MNTTARSRRRRSAPLARLLLLALLACILPSLAAGRPARPTSAALAAAELLRGRLLGVDHGGVLWAWDPVQEEISFVTRTGEQPPALTVKDAAVVDADAAWGVVYLTGEGKTLRWQRPRGGQAGEIALGEEAGALCWMGADRVAVSPRRAAHRIEVWDLGRKTRTAKLGQETEVKEVPGVVRLRDVLIGYDFTRQRLVSLDSFTGDLQVFAADGKPAWRAAVENAGRKASEEALAPMDAEARARGLSLPREIAGLWLAVAPDGAAWIWQRQDDAARGETLARVTAQGTTKKEFTGITCPSRTFTIWDDQVLFYSDVKLPRRVCNTFKPLS